MKSDNGEFLFIYATGTKQKFRGVGLLIRNKRLSFYLTSEKISDRIIKVCLAGKPSVTIIVAYAPSETAASNNKEEICNNILKAIECEPPHNIMIVLGNFNGRIGNDSHKTNPQIIGRNNYHEKANGNGKRFVSLCQQTSLRQMVGGNWHENILAHQKHS